MNTVGKAFVSSSPGVSPREYIELSKRLDRLDSIVAILKRLAFCQTEKEIESELKKLREMEG